VTFVIIVSNYSIEVVRENTNIDCKTYTQYLLFSLLSPSLRSIQIGTCHWMKW